MVFNFGSEMKFYTAFFFFYLFPFKLLKDFGIYFEIKFYKKISV